MPVYLVKNDLPHAFVHLRTLDAPEEKFFFEKSP